MWQDSLGGNAKTVMVANVSPAAACLKETHSTLGFAHRAKMIRNKVCLSATQLTAPPFVCLFAGMLLLCRSVSLSVCLSHVLLACAHTVRRLAITLLLVGATSACLGAQAVVNEGTTADALLLQKENERLRKELEMYRQLQQVCTVANVSPCCWSALDKK